MIKIRVLSLFVLSFLFAVVLAFAQTPQTECPPECLTDSMEIVTWYPSPYNEYEELRLYPKTDAEESLCDSSEKLGLMYYNKSQQALKVCWQDPSNLSYGWKDIALGQGGYWQVSGNDIYNTNAGNVQIGSVSTNSNLLVYGAIHSTGEQGVFSCPTISGRCIGQISFNSTCIDGSSQVVDCVYTGRILGGITSEFITSTRTVIFPPGVTSVWVTAVSAGGGGAGSGYDGNPAGDDGHPGQRVVSRLSVTPGLSYSIVIGRGGRGGSSGSAGSSGEASSISLNGATLLSVPGGGGANRGNCCCASNISRSCVYSNGGIYCDGGVGGCVSGVSGTNGQPGYIKLEY